MRMLGFGFVVLALSVGLALGVGLSENDASPRYDDEGDLLLPDGFESWVFVGSSLGLTYAAERTITFLCSTYPVLRRVKTP